MLIWKWFKRCKTIQWFTTTRYEWSWRFRNLVVLIRLKFWNEDFQWIQFVSTGESNPFTKKRLVLISICMIPILWESPYLKFKVSSIFFKNEHGHSWVSMERRFYRIDGRWFRIRPFVQLKIIILVQRLNLPKRLMVWLQFWFGIHMDLWTSRPSTDVCFCLRHWLVPNKNDKKNDVVHVTKSLRGRGYLSDT